MLVYYCYENREKNDEDEQSDDGSSKPKAGDVKVIADAISYDEILELVR